MPESDFIFGSYISSLAGECWSGSDCAEQGGTELFNSSVFVDKIDDQYYPGVFLLGGLNNRLRANNMGTLLAACATNSMTVGSYTNLN